MAPFTRRQLCSTAFALSASRLLSAQDLHPSPGSSRPDVATIDRDRILAAADLALTQKPDTLTSHPASNAAATPSDFVSTLEDPASAGAAPSFTAHREALLGLTLAVPALTSAWILTRTSDPARATTFAQHAASHLRAWFLSPSTRMEPSLSQAAVAPSTAGHPEGILETSALAEVALCLAFLARSEALSTDDLAGLRRWFSDLLKWLTTSRLAGLARDRKDHVGSSWLLQCAAYARTTSDDAVLADLRHHFKTVTLRAQIVADGSFPHELSTSAPYRNSLFNLDLLAGACDLLSTRFETLWDFQLQDGPGLRVAVARHVPFIQDRGTWPYRADSRLFNDLPCRRPALLLAARAYGRPEYASLWRSLNGDPRNPAILQTFPIRQPLLWVTRPQL